MAFVDDFRAAALPRLREAVKTQAFLVALDLADFESARDEVYTVARQAGLAMLRASDQERSVDWIRETIWAEHTKAVERVAALQSRVAAAERDDPIRFYEGLASRCAEPDRMRMVFASISKPYRKFHVEGHRARKA